MHVTAVIRGGAGVQKANVCDYQAVSYKCISSSDSGRYHCPYRHSSSLQQADRAARSRSNLHYTAGSGMGTHTGLARGSIYWQQVSVRCRHDERLRHGPLDISDLSRGLWLWYNCSQLLLLTPCSSLTGGRWLGRHGGEVGWLAGLAKTYMTSNKNCHMANAWCIPYSSHKSYIQCRSSSMLTYVSWLIM